jgi:hypothetical protein
MPTDDLNGPHFRPDDWPVDMSFELSAKPLVQRYFGSPGSTCVGGGGEGAIRLRLDWQMAFDVDGCTLLDFQQNVSGDALTYAAGPRWTPNVSRRWIPYAQLFVGGTKITHEHFDPEKNEELIKAAEAEHQPAPEHYDYKTEVDTNGLTVLAGGGVFYQITNGLLFRVGGLDYQRSSTGRLEGLDYSGGVRFSMGLALRMGPWRN